MLSRDDFLDDYLIQSCLHVALLLQFLPAAPARVSYPLGVFSQPLDPLWRDAFIAALFHTSDRTRNSFSAATERLIYAQLMGEEVRSREWRDCGRAAEHERLVADCLLADALLQVLEMSKEKDVIALDFCNFTCMSVDCHQE